MECSDKSINSFCAVTEAMHTIPEIVDSNHSLSFATFPLIGLVGGTLVSVWIDKNIPINGMHSPILNSGITLATIKLRFLQLAGAAIGFLAAVT